mmetsp:Transcript_16931/g.53742  ORF Transcript_16931/g.53742 Transcript_16931/m.53742 type:complete len:229 (-) Transcript_16931:268-954(-)
MCRCRYASSPAAPGFAAPLPISTSGRCSPDHEMCGRLSWSPPAPGVCPRASARPAGTCMHGPSYDPTSLGPWMTMLIPAHGARAPSSLRSPAIVSPTRRHSLEESNPLLVWRGLSLPLEAGLRASLPSDGRCEDGACSPGEGSLSSGAITAARRPLARSEWMRSTARGGVRAAAPPGTCHENSAKTGLWSEVEVPGQLPYDCSCIRSPRPGRDFHRTRSHHEGIRFSS